jgi:hypothetical protein
MTLSVMCLIRKLSITTLSMNDTKSNATQQNVSNFGTQYKRHSPQMQNVMLSVIF